MYEIQCGLSDSLRVVAPYYNLVLVVIVIFLFVKLFRTPNKKVFIKPWYFLFFSVLAYVFEQVMTVFEHANIITVPLYVHPMIEMVIIMSFIYMLLIQKEFLDIKTKK